MPNHCSNDLFVTGPADDVKLFIKESVKTYDDTKGVLDCNSILPYPKHLAELDAIHQKWEDALTEQYKLLRAMNENPTRQQYDEVYQQHVATHGERPRDGFNMGGYEWCCENWGTKWGCYAGEDVQISDMAGGKLKLKLTFDTAWSPLADHMYQKLSTKYPTLKIKNAYYEMGMGFKGYTVWQKGELLKRAHGKYRGKRGG